jgi:putative phosphoribosyl transferase
LEERFQDRREAGRKLAALLTHYREQPGVVVLGLPRGGVVVAFEVAKVLCASLDVIVVRKLGVPGHEELAMGAIASGGVRIINEGVVRELSLTADTLAAVSAVEQQELAHRERAFRGERPSWALQGRTVLLVDDGLATGATMRAAVAAVRTQQPAKIVVAVPVAAPETCEELRREVDEVVCARVPVPFFGVGQWYERFEQTTDEEVRGLLAAEPVMGKERGEGAAWRR